MGWMSKKRETISIGVKSPTSHESYNPKRTLISTFNKNNVYLGMQAL